MRERAILEKQTRAHADDLGPVNGVTAARHGRVTIVFQFTRRADAPDTHGR